MTQQPFLEDDLILLADIKPDDWSDFTGIFRWYIHSEHCVPVKFEDQGKLMAIGAVIFNENSAWLGHIITHRDYRNKGIGTKMTKTLIDIANQKRVDCIHLIATEMGFPVYRKCGFEIENQYSEYIKPKTCTDFTISNNLRPFEENDRQHLIYLDKHISGEERNKIILENLDDILVYQQNSKPAGFLIQSLGDGLILAENEEAGIELMKKRLLTKDSAILPSENKDGINFLISKGFKIKRQMKRMYLGKKPEWKPQQLFNRIGGHLG